MPHVWLVVPYVLVVNDGPTQDGTHSAIRPIQYVLHTMWMYVYWRLEREH